MILSIASNRNDEESELCGLSVIYSSLPVIYPNLAVCTNKLYLPTHKFQLSNI